MTTTATTVATIGITTIITAAGGTGETAGGTMSGGGTRQTSPDSPRAPIGAPFFAKIRL